MRRHAAFILTAAAACCALAAGAGAAIAATASPAGHWGNAQQITGLNNLNAGGLADVSTVSCGSPGNCVAGGTYHTADHVPHAFLAEEKGGAWGPQMQVTNISTTPAVVDSVSCSDAGDCTAVGHLISSIPIAFFVNEVNGTWRHITPLAADGVPSEPVSVSCAPSSPGNCAVGGWFTDSSNKAQPFVADERNGTWGPEQQVTALQQVNAGIDAQVTSVSCASPGNCAAAGHYKRASGILSSFIVDEFGGVWGNGHPIPEMSRLTTNGSEADAVSCASAGNCALAGAYTDGHGQQQVFTINEVNGDWILPAPVPGVSDLNVGGFAEVKGISCGAAGGCAVAGDYAADTRHTFGGFVAEEKNGTWQAARTVVGVANTVGTPAGSADTVSCPSAGNCVVGGSISTDTGTQAAVLSEVDGVWGSPLQVPGVAGFSTRAFSGVGAASCATAGNCAVGGFYQDSPGNLQAFVADESTATATTLKLSAATVKYGHEQSEKLSVSVHPRTGGTAGGKVTVIAGATTICVIKLASGKGSCRLTAKKLKPGSYRLTGIYSGDRTYDGSAYPDQTLTVTK